jgi:hypothetical protein
MKHTLPLSLAFLLGAAPAAAQTSGCVRDASGALHCASRPTTYAPNPGRRTVSTRDLSAAAIARGRAQAQSMREAADRQRQDTDARASEQRRMECPGEIPVTGAAAPATRPCGR